MVRCLPLGPAVALMLSLSAAGYEREGGAGGVCLWWASRTIRYEVNDFTVHPAAEVCGSPGSDLSAVKRAVQGSFAEWAKATRAGESAPCTDLALEYAGTTGAIQVGNDGHNVVVFRHASCESIPAGDGCHPNHTCANQYNCWAQGPVIALTTTTFDPKTGEIWDSDIELNAFDTTLGGSGTYFTCADPQGSIFAPSNACPEPPYGATNCVYMDVQNTVTHEVGHVLGLAHDPDSSTTMYASTPPYETPKRDLAEGDVHGICDIYPSGKEASTCGSVESDGGSARPPPKCGCTGTGAAGWLLVALAHRGLWRRRR